MPSERDLDALRAEVAELDRRIAELDRILDREQSLLATLEREFPHEPSWATGSKTSIRSTVDSLAQEKKRCIARANEIACHLPVRVEPMKRLVLKKRES